MHKMKRVKYLKLSPPSSTFSAALLMTPIVAPWNKPDATAAMRVFIPIAPDSFFK